MQAPVQPCCNDVEPEGKREEGKRRMMEERENLTLLIVLHMEQTETCNNPASLCVLISRNTQT